MNEVQITVPLRHLPIFKFNLTINLAKVVTIKLKMVHQHVPNGFFNPLEYVKFDGSDDQIDFMGFHSHFEQSRYTTSYEYVFLVQQIDLEKEVEIEIKKNCNYLMIEDESWFEIVAIENQ